MAHPRAALARAACVFLPAVLFAEDTEVGPIRIPPAVTKPARLATRIWAERQEQDPILRAMETELARSREYMDRTSPPPYYIDYRVAEVHSTEIEAELGSLTRDESDHYRWVDVTARVGSEKLDNTRLLSGDGEDLTYELALSDRLPLQNDEAVLRAVLWRLTAWGVGRAQRRLNVVTQATASAAEGTENPGDFTREEPVREFAPVALPEVDKEAWRRSLRSASSAFKAYPSLIRSGAVLQTQGEVRWFASTEGSRLRYPHSRARVSLFSEARADDGMPLELSVEFDAETASGLPGLHRLKAEAARLGELTEALRRAPVMEPYSGPVLLSGQAAAVFFHEILGHHLEGHRQEKRDEGAPFREQIGQRILSPLLTVRDDPTRGRYGKTFLLGAYRYDDEGVRGRSALLVEDGVLRGWLMSRDPVRGFSRSNGHGRSELGRTAIARQGVLITEASACLGTEALRARLKAEAARRGRPYGIYIEEVASGLTQTRRGGFQAFQVHPRVVWRVWTDDRSDELVRGANLVGTLLSGLEKVEAAGCEKTVFNGYCGAASGWVPVSSVAPAILLREMELARQKGSDVKPPVLPPPHGQGERR